MNHRGDSLLVIVVTRTHTRLSGTQDPNRSRSPEWSWCVTKHTCGWGTTPDVGRPSVRRGSGKGSIKTGEVQETFGLETTKGYCSGGNIF